MKGFFALIGFSYRHIKESTMSPHNQRFPNPNQGAPSQEPQMSPFGQQPGAAATYPSAPMVRTTTNNALLIFLILVMVLLIGGLVWAYVTYKQSPSDTVASILDNSMSTDQDSAEMLDQSDMSESESFSEELEAGRASNFQAPDNWTYCSGSGRAGNLNLVYSATDVTTCAFSNNVRDAFVEQYLETGNLNATVVADSPVTLKTYTMQCRDDRTKVTCTGGNNAVVVIV